MGTRFLLCGDNHGNVEALDRLIADLDDGDSFDYIVHTGDITNAHKTSLENGVEQLQAVEKRFEELAAYGPLLYIYGNRDSERAFMGDSTHVTERYTLDPGTRIPEQGAVTVAGQRFTSQPSVAGADDILVTHAPDGETIYSDTVRASFNGHTHAARTRGRALDTGYLWKKGFQGAYFTALLEDGELDVTVHELHDPWREFVCESHRWYGRQFEPTRFRCQLCEFGAGGQFNMMLNSVFTEAAMAGANAGDPSVATIDALVEHIRQRFCDDDQFAEQLRDFCQQLLEVENAGPQPFIAAPEQADALQAQYHEESGNDPS